MNNIELSTDSESSNEVRTINEYKFDAHVAMLRKLPIGLRKTCPERCPYLLLKKKKKKKNSNSLIGNIDFLHAIFSSVNFE